MPHTDGVVIPGPAHGTDALIAPARPIISVSRKRDATRCVKSWAGALDSLTTASGPRGTRARDDHALALSGMELPDKARSDAAQSAGAAVAERPADGPRIIVGGVGVVPNMP